MRWGNVGLIRYKVFNSLKKTFLYCLILFTLIIASYEFPSHFSWYNRSPYMKFYFSDIDISMIYHIIMNDIVLYMTSSQYIQKRVLPLILPEDFTELDYSHFICNQLFFLETFNLTKPLVFYLIS